MEKDTRVLIADDHTLFRDGLVALLNSVPAIDVVGTAQDGKEAIQLAADSQPDVILMDLLMPELNGIEATREIVRTSPHIGVVMLTMFEDNESVFEAMRAGGDAETLRAIAAEPEVEPPFVADPESPAAVKLAEDIWRDTVGEKSRQARREAHERELDAQLEEDQRKNASGIARQ